MVKQDASVYMAPVTFQYAQGKPGAARMNQAKSDRQMVLEPDHTLRIILNEQDGYNNRCFIHGPALVLKISVQVHTDGFDLKKELCYRIRAQKK